MMRLVVVGVVAAGLLVGACRDKEEPLVPTATLPQATTTTNPYAVPAVIDEAYVNRVLAGLDHAVGEVTRIVINERTISPLAVERLKALYLGEFLSLSVASYEADMRNGFSTYSSVPGDQATLVTRLISATRSCIFAEVARDYSAVSKEPTAEPSKEWIAVRPSTIVVQAEYNPTTWIYIYDGYDKSRTEPRDLCAAAS